MRISITELRSEVKKKDDEILQLRLSLMKKKVIGAFLSKPNLDGIEPTAEEKRAKRENMKTLQEESAHMKNIIQGLDSSARTLKLDIKKREVSLIRYIAWEQKLKLFFFPMLIFLHQ